MLNLKVLPLFLILISGSFSLHAEKLTIGVEKLDYLPFYGYANGEYQGYARELFDQFAKDNNHHIEYKILPVARLFQALISGKVDLKFPDNPNWKSSKKKKFKLYYSDGIVDFIDGIMVKPEFLKQPESFIVNIGTLRGFTPWPLLGQVKNKTIKLSESNSISALLQQGLLNRINGCYLNVDVAKYFLDKKLKKTNMLVFNSTLAHDKGKYYLSSTTKPKILGQFNQWLKVNKKFNQQLKDKWNL